MKPPGLTPALIFKLELHPQGQLDEEALERLGLTLLARDPDKTIAVFASDEDLRELQRRLRSYAGDVAGPGYAELGGIERIAALTAEDRIGRRLRLEPVGEDDEDVPVDVEAWHPGTREAARRLVEELRMALPDLGARITDAFVGTDLIILRCRVGPQALAALLDLEQIREVDRIPRADLEPAPAVEIGEGDVPEAEEPPDEAAGVLVLDSGVTANHPLLRAAIGEARAFPERLGEHDGLGPEDGERRTGGHGTSVSGIAIYGDVARELGSLPLRPAVNLFSGRILDEDCAYDPDELVEHQLEAAVRYFLDTYPECRVINLSLGDDRLVVRDDDRQFRLAARIDELAYELQARDVLFVISSGNFSYDPPSAGDEVRRYPTYLLSADARIIEPATSALGLTVGGLATGRGPERFPDDAGRRAIAAAHGYPSPFTRSGWGIDGMIKPELVELAGDLVYDPRGTAPRDEGPGVLSARRDFAPPTGSLLRRVNGTSFSAPAVAHIAARLFDRFPEASSNLVRALLADSAQVPRARPAPLDGAVWTNDVLRVFGYGRPDFDRAAASDENDVLLIADQIIAPDSFQLFEIPELSDEFMEFDGDRLLSVSLAFDPPTRRTRGDSYLGLTMQFRMFRNSDLATIEGAFRDWSRAPAGPDEAVLEQRLSELPGRQRIDLRPGVTLCSRGTLQKAVFPIRSRAWQYDGGPLILAVSCLRKWAPEEIVAQRYAVVASIKHSNPDVRLHARLRQRLQPRLRVRIR